MLLFVLFISCIHVQLVIFKLHICVVCMFESEVQYFSEVFCLLNESIEYETTAAVIIS